MAGPEPSPSPKILLAKPGLVTGAPLTGKFTRGVAGEDDSTQLRSRLPSVASLNLLSDSWDFHFDRFLPLAVFLASVCHILLVVSEGVDDDSMWHLMSTVDLLKHDISDPSLLASSLSHNSSSGHDNNNKVPECEYMATPVFVHTKLQDQELTSKNCLKLKKALMQYFKPSSFVGENTGNKPSEENHLDSDTLNLFTIPFKKKEENPRAQHESYISALWKLRDQILAMKSPSFRRPVSEREWLKNSAKIWEQVKNSPTIFEYYKTLQHSGMYRS
ncbi:hypothetical protein TSUD_229150 [Trifolium subterraneum]|uniref:Uncharacterized protein n=1 Tax=Trifolium subterraneum TaxID=3900 RepID=A0A2Z6MRU6_TRISU|nr:hypothetical protein TSUD_229150 [Trifolium subterraneum]